MNIVSFAKRITQSMSTLIMCFLFFFGVPMFLVKLANAYHIWEKLKDVPQEYKVLVFYVSRDIFLLLWLTITAVVIILLWKNEWLYLADINEKETEKPKGKPRVDYSGRIVSILIIIPCVIFIGAHLSDAYITVLRVFP